MATGGNLRFPPTAAIAPVAPPPSRLSRCLLRSSQLERPKAMEDYRAAFSVRGAKDDRTTATFRKLNSGTPFAITVYAADRTSLPAGAPPP